jgi:hypothetical protein
VDYKGYRVDITVIPEQPDPTFRAIFKIRTGMGTTALTGTITGSKTMEEAERTAQTKACRWIDERT